MQYDHTALRHTENDRVPRGEDSDRERNRGDRAGAAVAGSRSFSSMGSISPEASKKRFRLLSDARTVRGGTCDKIFWDGDSGRSGPSIFFRRVLQRLVAPAQCDPKTS